MNNAPRPRPLDDDDDALRARLLELERSRLRLALGKHLVQLEERCTRVLEHIPVCEASLRIQVRHLAKVANSTADTLLRSVLDDVDDVDDDGRIR